MPELLSNGKGDAEKRQAFYLLDKKTFQSFSDNELKASIAKWSMAGQLHLQQFSYDGNFLLYNKDKFFQDFFACDNVQRTLATVNRSGIPGTVGTSIHQVMATPVPATVLSMELFDRLLNGTIVRKNGVICKCFDEFVDSIQISDELKKVLVMEDSDNFCLFDETERAEFLFRIFSLVTIGGGICQYEDEIEPYLNVTRQLYKDVIAVTKETDSDRIRIASHVFQLTGQDDSGDVVYPTEVEHRQTVSFAAVDPAHRTVTVLYHRFGAGAI